MIVEFEIILSYYFNSEGQQLKFYCKIMSNNILVIYVATKEIKKLDCERYNLIKLNGSTVCLVFNSSIGISQFMFFYGCVGFIIVTIFV